MNALMTNRNNCGLSARGPQVSRVSLRSFSASLLGLIALALIGIAITYFFVFFAIAIATAQPPAPVQTAPQAVNLVLEDQFDRKADLAALRGQVVILVYGDKKASDMCRQIGESLHVCWHPEAKGQPPAKAQSAPVVPLDNLQPGQTSTNVVVVPVACCGKVPFPPSRLLSCSARSSRHGAGLSPVASLPLVFRACNRRVRCILVGRHVSHHARSEGR